MKINVDHFYKYIPAYQTDPHILEDLESHWEQLASNIFEYNDTLPLKKRPNVAAKIKLHYLNDKPVSQSTYPQLVKVNPNLS